MRVRSSRNSPFREEESVPAKGAPPSALPISQSPDGDADVLRARGLSVAFYLWKSGDRGLFGSLRLILVTRREAISA